MLESGAEEITVCNVASSYSMDVKKMCSMGKCVELFCDTIERFTDEDKNLHFHAEILKVKEAHKYYYCKTWYKRTTDDFDITSKSQYINEILLMKENKRTRNSEMQQESPRFPTHFFFKSIVLVKPFEQHGQCMYQCLQLTDLQISHRVIKAGCCL